MLIHEYLPSSIPLGAGLFDRAVYLEGIKRRITRELKRREAMKNQSNSTVCSISWSRVSRRQTISSIFWATDSGSWTFRTKGKLRTEGDVAFDSPSRNIHSLTHRSLKRGCALSFKVLGLSCKCPWEHYTFCRKWWTYMAENERNVKMTSLYLVHYILPNVFEFLY